MPQGVEYHSPVCKRKTPPVLAHRERFQEQLVHEEQYSPKTTVLYHLRAGLSKCTHMEVYYGTTYEYRCLVPKSEPLAD